MAGLEPAIPTRYRPEPIGIAGSSPAMTSGARAGVAGTSTTPRLPVARPPAITARPQGPARALPLAQGPPRRGDHRLDGRHALSAAAVRLPRRDREGLGPLRDLQDHGAAAPQGDHQPGNDRCLGARALPCDRERMVALRLDAGEIRARGRLVGGARPLLAVAQGL